MDEKIEYILSSLDYHNLENKIKKYAKKVCNKIRRMQADKHFIRMSEYL